MPCWSAWSLVLRPQLVVSLIVSGIYERAGLAVCEKRRSCCLNPASIAAKYSESRAACFHSMIVRGM